MLAKCSMVGKDEGDQYRSQDLPCIPVVNTITVVIVMKIKMLFKVIFIQLLLLSVQSSTALKDHVEILVQHLTNKNYMWTTKSFIVGEASTLHRKDYIPGLDLDKTKNLDTHNMDYAHHILSASGETNKELFGIEPILMDVTGEEYEIVGQRNAVNEIFQDNLSRLKHQKTSNRPTNRTV